MSQFALHAFVHEFTEHNPVQLSEHVDSQPSSLQESEHDFSQLPPQLTPQEAEHDPPQPFLHSSAQVPEHPV